MCCQGVFCKLPDWSDGALTLRGQRGGAVEF